MHTYTHTRVEGKGRREGEMNEDSDFILIIPMLVPSYLLCFRESSLWELCLITQTWQKLTREVEKDPNFMM